MKIIFMGTPDFSVPILQALLDADHEIAAVYTQPPRPAGRGKKLRQSAVHQHAERLGISVETPLNFKGECDRERFASYQADVAIVVAYGLILPQSVLDTPRFGCVNVHASLLPRWRGAAPIHRAVMAGDLETGVCIMQMEAGLDTGPVLMREACTIDPRETTGQLHDRLSQLGAKLTVQTLHDLPERVAIAQPDEGVTYAHKIEKAEARVDWAKPAADVARHICGLSPFPGAWCHVGEERVKLLEAHVLGAHRGSDEVGASTSSSSPVGAQAPALPRAVLPGTVLAGGFVIACEDGAVEVTRVQRAGKTPLPAREALNGLELGARLL